MKLLSLFVFFLVCTALSKSLPRIDWEKPDIIFQVGKFNSIPKDAESKLVVNGFKLKESTASTVQVKNPTEFPQIIRPGQRFAIFLDDLLSTTTKDKNHLLLTLKLVKSPKSEYLSSPIIEIKYNSSLLFRHWISASNRHSQQFKILIPEKYHERGRNVLEIRNNGKSIAAFDAIKIVKFSPYETDPKSKSSKFSNKLPVDVRYYAKEAASLAERDKTLRDKSPRFLTGLIMEHLNNNKKPIFPIAQFASLNSLYDPFTGKPILAYYCLPILKLFFEGAENQTHSNKHDNKQIENKNESIYYKRSIQCNVFPENKESAISNVSLTSVIRNNKDTITFGFKPSSSNMRKKMKAIIPIP